MAPGETIRECMQEWGLSAEVTAAMLNLYAADFNAILIGKNPITDHIAKKLEEAFGVDRHTWLALERNYRRGLSAGKKDVTNRDL